MDPPTGVPPLPASALPHAPEAPRPPAFPPTTQLAVGLLLVAGVFFLMGRWSRDSGTLPAPAAAAIEAGTRLDLNRATRAELRLLPGVGDALARRIVDHRERAGPFRDLDALRQVAGVGPKTLDRLHPWLFVSTPDDAEERPVARMELTPAMHRTAPLKQVKLTELIDVNHADTAELRKLPGIGPKMAQRVLDERALRGPFKTVDDLRRVAGIGPKTLERLRPLVTVERPTEIKTAFGR